MENQELDKENSTDQSVVTDSDVYDAELNPADDMRERRYLWIARIFAVFSAVSLCTNIVLLIAVGNMLPLNRVEPYYLTFQNKADQIVSVRNLNRDSKVYNIVIESLVREFVQLLNTVIPDEDEMNRRWGADGLLQWMTGDNVFRYFKNGDYQTYMNRIRKERFTRSVTISAVNSIDENKWSVRFATVEMVGDASTPTTRKWSATVTVRPQVVKRQREVTYSDRLKNPLGLVISDYTVMPDKN